MATSYDTQLGTLQSRADLLHNELVQSPTAIGGETEPTSQDLAKQTQYTSLQKTILGLRKKAMQEKWYGPSQKTVTAETQTEGVKPQGAMMSALDTLAKPMYGIEGAVAHVLGKGTGKNIFDSMSQNMNVDKRTFGDLLKSENVPYAISAPLGFALDVAFDPVNWATVGTAALIPRIATGFGKGLVKDGVVGAAKGTALAAKSGFLNKASVLEKYTPTPLIGSTARYKNVVEKMQGGALRSTEEYNKFIGKDINKLIGNYGVPTTIRGLPSVSAVFSGSKYRSSLGDMIQIASKVNPVTEKIFDSLNYSNKDWMRLARIKDSLQNSLGVAGTTFNDAMKAWQEGKPIDEFIQTARNVIEKTPPARNAEDFIDWGATTKQFSNPEIDRAVSDLAAMKSQISIPTVANDVANGMEDATTIIHNPEISYTMDPIENAIRVASESTGSPVTLDDIKTIIHSGELGDTGVKWYDNTVSAINKLKYTAKTKDGEKVYQVGKNVLEGYQTFINIFKRAKVGANPSSWMNATLGNPTMAWMAGINVFDKQYIKRLSSAAKMSIGTKDSDVLLREFFENAELSRVMKDTPTAFSRTTGMSPKYTAMRFLVAKALRTAEDSGMSIKGIDKTQLAGDLSKELDDVLQSVLTSDDVLKAQEAVSKTTGTILKSGIDSPVQMARELLKEGGISTTDLPTSMAANELLDSKMANKLFDALREKAESQDATFAQKALNTLFNKSVDAYDHIDQSYKNATIMYATKDGLTEGELRKIARFVQMTPEDLLTPIVKDGITRYPISGEKALELANETFLNYNAMPAAIKVLRNVPLLGSPFASFTYGMLLKTANTAAYNPSAFNKISFAINDFGGSQTPLEKKALSGKYYSYLDTPSMFKVPGGIFEQNPIYLNLANMIPYYSFNMFNPSERKYSDLYPEKLVNAIDATPFLKDPVGSVLFDYLIQPMILNESTTPVGSFNQPLYPYGSNIGTKALYAGRQLTEALVPGVVAPLGAFVPPKYSELLPSYGMRKFSNAIVGQNPQGIPGSEDKWSRVSRAIAGYTGLPVQAPVDLTYTSKK